MKMSAQLQNYKFFNWMRWAQIFRNSRLDFLVTRTHNVPIKFDFFREYLHRSAENHSMRRDSSQIGRLQICQNDNHTILHLFDRYEINETADDRTRTVLLAEVNFLDVQRIRVRVFRYLDNFSHTYV